MLEPRKLKHRKVHRGRSDLKGIATRGNKVSFGTYGLKSIESGELTPRQIEAARRVMTRYTKKGGKIWINIFPHKPVSKKAQEVPMGSGKGTLDHYVAAIKPGRVLFEMDGIPANSAKEAMILASHKLPVKCKFINTED
ncbi:MAG: 50S ribosomal protein L16 [Candidatus Gracilibacteria bacterium]|nr:50S ribosomal protein L16 [Candidatus Gracilibacteria bacterium]